MNSLTLTTPLPLDQNPAAVYIASLGGPSSTGGRTQAQALRVIAQIFDADPISLDWAALRYQHTSMVRARIMEHYSPASANKILSALRQTLERAFLLGQMTAEDYQRAIKLEPVKGSTVLAGRELSADEIKSLMDVCKADENRHAGVRDAAMIALMYIALLRRDEVAKLSLPSYDPETGRITLTGKRRKQRTVYVTNGARDALNDWLQIRGSAPGALFVAINKTGRISSLRHLSSQVVYNVTIKRSLQAGVQDNSPHNFRRTAISNLLDSNETDIVTIAKLAGHSNVNTTARYDRRPEENKKKASSLLHVPY